MTVRYFRAKTLCLERKHENTITASMFQKILRFNLLAGTGLVLKKSGNCNQKLTRHRAKFSHSSLSL